MQFPVLVPRQIAAVVLVALAAAACQTAEPAVAPAREVAPQMSASELAERLSLVRRVRESGEIVLESADGDSIVLYPDTTVVSVHGTTLTSTTPVATRSGDVWLTKEDAALVESTWITSTAMEPRDWPTLEPLPEGAAGTSGASGSYAPSSGLYTDRPTASEMRAWSVAGARRAWRYIVIHHSATDTGNAKAFDAEHKQRRDKDGRHWEGLGYDFVIGNGTGSADGAVEVGYRWRDQKRGAHAGNDLMNEQGIGICLVGDFTKTRPTAAQMRSLSRLCNFLSSYCGIPRSNYRLHGDVRQTSCPGPLFPRDFLDEPRPARATAAARSPDPGPR
jgi:N-acetylmuramoyl-L-alanine amidase